MADHSNRVRVVSRLPKTNPCFPRVRLEYQWAEMVSAGHYRLLSIPSCDRDLNYLDVVTAEARRVGDVQFLEITGIAQRGGQRTFDVHLRKPRLFDRMRRVEQKALIETLIEDLEANVEKRGKLSYGVSIPARYNEPIQKLFLAAMHPEEGAIEGWGMSGASNGWELGHR